MERVEELSKVLSGLQDIKDLIQCTDKLVVENKHSTLLLQKSLDVLEANLEESFGRINKRIEALEEYHLTVGCVPAQTIKHDFANMEQKINKQQESTVWVIRTIIGAVILAVIAVVMKV